MAFVDTTVSFTPSGDHSQGWHSDRILNIKGFNDSGKSALLVATGVCLLNAYARKSKSFIRDGAEFFRVTVSFDDGVQIMRERHRNGLGLYEMSKDGTLVYTTRAGDLLTAVDDIPGPIAEYLGLHPDLNMRRRTDPMLLVSTSGSENFKFLNDVLKTEELSGAAQDASAAANEMNANIDGLQVKLEATQQMLDNYWQDDTFLTLVEQDVAQEEELEHNVDILAGSLSLLESLINHPDPAPVPPLLDAAQQQHHLQLLHQAISIGEQIRSLEELPVPEELTDNRHVLLEASQSIKILGQVHEVENTLRLLREKLSTLDPDGIFCDVCGTFNLSGRSEHVHV